MVYDLARKVVVLVTSGPSQEAGRLQTWTWDGRRWTRRMPTTSPTTRDGALLAYDSSRHVTILYGGLNHDYLTDTWEWNGSNWALRHPDHAPDTSQSGSLAYEPVSHRTLLYQFQHQTWSWDGKDWTQLQPAHVPDLELGNLVFDNTRIILVGGLPMAIGRRRGVGPARIGGFSTTVTYPNSRRSRPCSTWHVARS